MNLFKSERALTHGLTLHFIDSLNDADMIRAFAGMSAPTLNNGKMRTKRPKFETVRKEKDLPGLIREAQSKTPIFFALRATNKRAIRLYSKFGFFEEGRFKDRVRLIDGSFVDDLAMAWFPQR